MQRSAPVDGFRLAYGRSGSGPPVVLLHGWPGDHTDYEDLVPLLTDRAEVVVPDLRGFGRSDKHAEPPADAYSAVAQARSVLGLIAELGLEPPVIAGYDVGSRIAQAIARDTPEAVRALVVSPPLPGAGERVLAAEAQREFWYQSFHQLPLVEEVPLARGERRAEPDRHPDHRAVAERRPALPARLVRPARSLLQPGRAARARRRRALHAAGGAAGVRGRDRGSLLGQRATDDFVGFRSS